ncbi:hypothetical protein [Nostoc sp. UHCC 0926]|nr:hypothetical protein [Nostoc sp. UHCC 0926]
MHLIFIKRTAKYAKYAKEEGIIIKCKFRENWYNSILCGVITISILADILDIADRFVYMEAGRLEDS